MRVRVSRRARQELVEARDYIALDNPAAARRIVERFDEITTLIMSGLIEGPDVVLSDGRPARRWSMPPYRIYYRRHARSVEILRVYHQARRPIER